MADRDPDRRLLGSYVSRLLAARLLPEHGFPQAREARGATVAVLLADVAGFTPLAERLSLQPDGTEELSHLLDASFGALVARVEAAGGHIVNFAGDALLAVWEAGEGVASATQAAAACALSLNETAAGQRGSFGSNVLPLSTSLRVGVGAGRVLMLRVGGVGGQWHLLLVGDAVTQAGRAARHAEAGSVVLSPAASRCAGDVCTGTVEGGGFLRLTQVNGAPGADEFAPARRVSAEAVRACVPAVVQAGVASGQERWLPGLRWITSMFVALIDGKLPSTNALQLVDTLVTEAQHVLLASEGTLEHVAVDDTGVKLVVSFGTPPLAHRDDAARAIAAAVDLRASLRRQGITSTVGISTGRVFTGSVGSDLHRERVILGDSVNLAARLMQAARGTVLCDQATYEAARTRWVFDTLPTITVKGKSAPVAIYRPVAPVSMETRFSDARQPLVGRSIERMLFGEYLGRLQQGQGGALSMSGDAGIGKTGLMRQAASDASTRGIRVLQGRGDLTERVTPYFALRHVLTELLGVGELDLETRRQAVIARLGGSPALAAQAPLLESVLPLGFVDTALTRQMTGQTAADSTVALILGLLTSGQGSPPGNDAPLVLLLDDAQWIDPASWAVVQAARAQIPTLLLVVAGRTDGEDAAEGYLQLLGDRGVDQITLGPLALEEGAALVAQLLPHAPAQLAQLVARRAEGIPLFLEELTYALGTGDIEDDARPAAPGPSRLAAEAWIGSSVPAGVEGVVLERMDRLPSAAQLTLKVASVLGQVFSQEALLAVHPLHPRPSDLRAWLDELQAKAFLVSDPPASSDLRFRHGLAREAAYGTLLRFQRQPLHQVVAEWYERDQPSVHPMTYRTLAHHWDRAGKAGRALDYLELAGDHALRHGAHAEAIDALLAALSAASGAAPLVGPQRRARWHRQLADAYMGLGRLSDSRGEAMEALALLGLARPSSSASAMLDLAGQAARQAVRTRRTDAGLGLASGEVADAARAYERLALIEYYGNDRFAALSCALHSVNIAETMSLSPELARGYATLGLGSGMLGLHRLARRYTKQADELVRQLDDSPALTFVLMSAAAYWLSIGSWSRAGTSVEEGLGLAELVGDQRRWSELAALKWQLLYHEGRVDLLDGLAQRMREVAERAEDDQRLAHVLLLEALSVLLRGGSQPAAHAASQALELLTGRGAHADEIIACGVLAQAHLSTGRHREALDAADRALRLMMRTRPVAVHAIEGYAFTAEVLLRVSEQGRSGVARRARAACRALDSFARSFPLARPRALWCRGLLRKLQGRPRVGQAARAASLAVATTLEMPYEQARAHLQIAQNLPVHDAARQHHLDEARLTFIRLGAADELRRTRLATEAADRFC